MDGGELFYPSKQDFVRSEPERLYEAMAGN